MGSFNAGDIRKMQAASKKRKHENQRGEAVKVKTGSAEHPYYKSNGHEEGVVSHTTTSSGRPRVYVKYPDGERSIERSPESIESMPAPTVRKTNKL